MIGIVFKIYLPRVALFLFAIFPNPYSFGQSNFIVGGTSSAWAYHPFYSYMTGCSCHGSAEDYKAGYMYTQAALGNPGTISISKIAWYVMSSSSGTGGTFNNFIIKLKNVSNWSNCPNFLGGTLVYGPATVTINSTVVPNGTWVEFTLSSPFTWNSSDNLYIETCYDNSSGSPVGGGSIAIAGTGAIIPGCGYGRYPPTTGVSVCNLTGTIPGSTGSIGGTWVASLRITGSTGLPVELITFDALYDGKAVVLNWSTASEINNDFFTVEKTTNGIDFALVAKIKGAGNSSTLMHYHSVDDNPFPGISAYRLRQTDFDGKYEFSRMVAVNNNHKSKVEIIFINKDAEDGSIDYLINTSGGKTFNMEVFDLLGKTVISQFNIESAGRIDIGKLTHGIYVCRVSDADNSAIKKFVY